MATAETVDLGPSHPPKEDSIKAFNEILPDLKRELVRLRHDYDKHEKEYFAVVEKLDDHQLTDFGEDDLTAVRVAMSAYGVHLFGKVRLRSASGSYIHVRVFITSGEPAKLHSIHTEEKDDAGGGKSFRAIFKEGDELEWFDT